MKVDFKDIDMNVEYCEEQVIDNVRLDGELLRVVDNTIIMPWGEVYTPRLNFRGQCICPHTFYGRYADQWIKTLDKWIFKCSGEVCTEKIEGGTLRIVGDINYIIYPPFPEIPPLRQDYWCGWKITGAIWDEKEVTFIKGRFELRLPMFFIDVGTIEEWKILSKEPSFFGDNVGDMSDGTSLSYRDFFWERIKFLEDIHGEKLTVLKDERVRTIDKIKEEVLENERRREELKKYNEETVEVPYYFLRLEGPSRESVVFSMVGEEVYRKYGNNEVLLPIDSFPKQMTVEMSRSKTQRRLFQRKKDLRGGYEVVYAPTTDHKVVGKEHEYTVFPCYLCSCGASIDMKKYSEHKEKSTKYLNEISFG